MPPVNRACFDPAPPRPHSRSVFPLFPHMHFSRNVRCESPFRNIYLQSLKSIFWIQVAPTKAYKSLFLPGHEEYTDEHNSSSASIGKNVLWEGKMLQNILILIIYKSFKVTRPFILKPSKDSKSFSFN